MAAYGAHTETRKECDAHICAAAVLENPMQLVASLLAANLAAVEAAAAVDGDGQTCYVCGPAAAAAAAAARCCNSGM